MQDHRIIKPKDLLETSDTLLLRTLKQLGLSRRFFDKSIDTHDLASRVSG